LSDPLSALVIAAAGFLMGAVNNLAGGGGAIALVAFEECAGLDPKTSNASLRPAAISVSAGGTLGFWRGAQRIPGHAWRLALYALPGAAAGSFLVVETPVVVDRAVLSLILVTVLWQQLHPAARRPPPETAPRASGWLEFLGLTLVGLHMGYIQVGAGLVTLAVMTALHERDLVRINVVKLIIVLLTSVTSVGILAWQEAITWGPAVALMVGSFAGSFAAGRWSARRGHGGVRIAVLVITSAVLVRLLWQIATGR
jgi:hypothetical protein